AGDPRHQLGRVRRSAADDRELQRSLPIWLGIKTRALYDESHSPVKGQISPPFVNLPHEVSSPRAIPPLLKNLNERAVLEMIRAGAPISRAEISRRAGISKPTVSL